MARRDALGSGARSGGVRSSPAPTPQPGARAESSRRPSPTAPHPEAACATGSPAASGVISYGTGTFEGHAAFAVNWGGVKGVGYRAGADTKLNNFQLLLVERSYTGPGNFDIVFNYNQI